MTTIHCEPSMLSIRNGQLWFQIFYKAIMASIDNTIRSHRSHTLIMKIVHSLSWGKNCSRSSRNGLLVLRSALRVLIDHQWESTTRQQWWARVVLASVGRHRFHSACAAPSQINFQQFIHTNKHKYVPIDLLGPVRCVGQNRCTHGNCNAWPIQSGMSAAWIALPSRTAASGKNPVNLRPHNNANANQLLNAIRCCTIFIYVYICR